MLPVCSCHVTYAFQSKSTLYSCLNVKELLAQNRREIWSSNDCNCTRTHNHLLRKWTLNHLAKLASLVKWLSVRLQTKWLWVWVQLQSLKAWSISPLFIFITVSESMKHYMASKPPVWSLKTIWQIIGGGANTKRKQKPILGTKTHNFLSNPNST